MLIEREYAGIVKHENTVLRARWWHGCLEEGIVKWLWGSFGVRRSRFLHVFSTDKILSSYAFVQFLFSSVYLASLAWIWDLGQKVCS